jgi:hypothetical protein
MTRALLGLSTAAALLVVALLVVRPVPAADPNVLVIEGWSEQPEGKTGIPEG